MAEHALRIEGVWKQYSRRGIGAPTLRDIVLNPRRRRRHDRFWALQDVNLQVGFGDTVGLIGANGSGKSTLLRLIGDLGRPTRGRIRRRARVSAMMTLGEAFDPLLTGRENAVTAGILAGYTTRQARGKLDEITKFAELEEFIDLPLRTYSDGMRMRLAFSVAASTEPELLLIDEVLSVGDLRFQNRCFERLDELRAAGATILFASHDETQIRRLCDRVVWLSHGRMQACGGADEVYQAYQNAMRVETERRAVAVGAESRHSRSDLQLGENRFGTLEVEIASVRVLQAGADAARHGQIGVEIELRPHSAVHDPIVGVSLSHLSDGVRALDLNTAGDNIRLGKLETPRTITLWLERVDVAPGSYRFDVGIYERDWTYVYDYHWQAYPLEVYQTTAGNYGPPHRWIVA